MDKIIDIVEIRNAVANNEPKPVGKHRYSSVLIPLVFKDGEWQVLFEVRAETLNTQPGEISFPGGKAEPGETPMECAVRETCEEVGISEGDISVIGELNYIVTYSNFTMYSFLGEVDSDALENTMPNVSEVKELFYVPLTFFMSNEPEVYINTVAPVLSEDFPVNKVPAGDRYPWRTGTSEVPIYTYKEPEGKERIIWGLTARLVKDFSDILKSH